MINVLIFSHSLLSVSTVDPTDQPTLIECIKFRGRERRINIAQEIGVKYQDFCLFLLEDENRQRLKAIAQENTNKAEQINKEILEQWITGRGKQPVIWKTLTEVLRDIELTTLAEEIEAVKCHEEETIGQVLIGTSDDSVEGDQKDMLTVETTEESLVPMRTCPIVSSS